MKPKRTNKDPTSTPRLPLPLHTGDGYYTKHNGPVTVRRIEDYPQEDQERWNNIKPARNSDGKVIGRPVVTALSNQGRNKK